MLAKEIDNIKFLYRRRSANELADRIVKEAIQYCTKKLLIMNNFSCLLFKKKKREINFFQTI